MKASLSSVRGRTAVAALGLGAALALVAPSGAAVGQQSPPLTLGVNVQSPVTLLARGAALSVSVDIVCTQGAEGDVSVSVAQRVGGGTATGTGGSPFVCTGTNQEVEIIVQASSGKAFRTGVASVSSSAFVYTGGQSVSANDHEVVRIVRR